MRLGNFLGGVPVKKIVWINAGHFAGDPGSSCPIPGRTLIERDEVMKIRDVAAQWLTRAGFSVKIVPDDLNLTDSVAFVNQTAKEENDGMALDIHLNSSKYRLQGTEVYSGDSAQEKSQAGIIAETLSKSIGVPNRGYKSQTQSYWGSLMWINQVKCWSHIVECLYMSSEEDRKVLNYEKIGKGIAMGVANIYGMEVKIFLAIDEIPPALSLQQQINELRARIAQLIQQVTSFLKK